MKHDFCNGCIHNAVCGHKNVTCDIADYIIDFSARVPKHLKFDFDLFCKYKKYNIKPEEEYAKRESDNEETAQSGETEK